MELELVVAAIALMRSDQLERVSEAVEAALDDAVGEPSKVHGCARVKDGIINIAREVPRVRGQSDHAEVIIQVKEFGGFTCFWASDSKNRAFAITAAIRDGYIVSVDGAAYPWSSFRLGGGQLG